jgi:hypothetical protein
MNFAKGLGAAVVSSLVAGAANAEQMAKQSKNAFVGKDLYFSNGHEVGKILDVRRWSRDKQLYMIVAAGPFFNEDVDYAVPVEEISRVADDRVELPEDPGLHLRGMEYYPEDFEDMKADESVPLSEEQ